MDDFKLPKPTTYANLEQPGVLSSTNLLPWQTNVSDETHKNLGTLIKDTEGMVQRQEGQGVANAASNAIFNMAKGGGMSQALSSRASKLMGLSGAENDFGLRNQNVHRQRREVSRLNAQLNNVEKLKMLNYEGQLRFADQVADYNDNLQAAKYEVLGSIIGGMGSFYGGVAGNMSKGGLRKEMGKRRPFSPGFSEEGE